MALPLPLWDHAAADRQRPPDLIRISVILLSGQGRRQGSRDIGLLLVYRTITNAEGARALHLSLRQFQRLKRRLAAEGPAAI